MFQLPVVVDTNIFISAILFGGHPEEILRLARVNRIKIFISSRVLREIIRVFKLKFDWDYLQLREVETEIKELTFNIEPKNRIKIIESDPSDNKFLEIASESESQFIISGDKHLLSLKTYEGIRIVTAKEFLEIT